MIIRNFNQVIFIIICVCLIIPRFSLFGFGIGMDDIMVISILLLYLVNKWRILNNYVSLLFITVILTLIFLGLVSGILNLDKIIFPTAVWQYVKRFTFFVFLLQIAYYEKLTLRKFNNTYICIMTLALIISMIQLIPGSIGNYFQKLYAFQYSLEYLGKRVGGIAGHPSMWAGLCAFFVCRLSRYWLVA